ncbi:hypothetical protein [Kribbella jiaozuonensis]|uniref:Uncharacterized protein n=1 Tax=Kribbella jiaozuonensis TaxID=2575441 RepID=A0A4U3LRD8_9ACTN|nr:hypothetical protein [Kribbella jiaozuonensis]TKK77724.1 hypothetical protein FDA38_21510 [Kribbella jiaozuonensis]
MGDAPQVHTRPLTWPFVIEVLQTRLGMWVGRPTYERAIALVIGFDMAQAESINQRLQSRVSERRKTGSISWPSALLEEAIGDEPRMSRDLGPLSPEQDARAIDLLVRELRAVLGDADVEPS